MFVGNALDADVGEAGALEPRFDVGEAFFGGVKGVDAAAAGHLGADGEGFAAGAGAEIDYGFAAAGAEQQRQQLAAFVLDFERAAGKQRMAGQRRFAADADAVRRVGRGGGAGKLGLQLR